MNDQGETGKPADNCVKDQYVEDDRTLPIFLSREEVERAHPESERQRSYRRRDNQKKLLIQPEIMLAQTTHEQQRLGEAEGKGEHSRKHKPCRARRQRNLFLLNSTHRNGL